MFEIGGAVSCAIDNDIYGPNTVSLFQDGSAFYIAISIFYFLFDLFVSPIIFVGFYALEVIYFFAAGAIASSGLLIWWVPFLNLIPLSSLTLWWLPIIPYYMFVEAYIEITRFGTLLLSMFFTNAVFFGFHPTVAPELQGERAEEETVLDA